MRLKNGLLLAMFLLAGGGAVLAPSASAEPVKYIKPEQYDGRIVAPRKGRVLLVNFWATWCAPCREEMPALVNVSKKFRNRDLAVILISVDTKKTASVDVPKVLGQLKVPFVAYLAKTHDPQVFIDVVDASWDGSLPYTIIYSRDGRPVVKLSGSQTEASLLAGIRKAQAATVSR